MSGMAARIGFLCDEEHAVYEPGDYTPIFSVYEGEWAYCRNGGRGGHDWREVAPPMPIQELPLTPRGRLLLPDD